MQPNDSHSFRLLFLAELDRLNDRLREFGAEVRRQEDTLRALYPRIASALRRDGGPAETKH